MDFEEAFADYRMVAPDVDALLRYFDRGHMNPGASTPELLAAAESLFAAMSPLAPIDQDGEVKAIWLRIPRGTIDNYTSFEDMKEWGEVETYEEYRACWQGIPGRADVVPTGGCTVAQSRWKPSLLRR